MPAVEIIRIVKMQAYRQSELFRNTWVFVKTLFAAPAEAWTVNELQQL